MQSCAVRIDAGLDRSEVKVDVKVRRHSETGTGSV